MKKRLAALALALCLALAFTACEYVDQAVGLVKEVMGDSSSSASVDTTPTKSWQQTVADTVAQDGFGPTAPDDKVRSWYEVFVYSFADADADGVGDFAGLIQQLDYIHYMGFNGLWLMPIHPSPSYHKYDVTDYYAVDVQYGTMAGFEQLIEACSRRGIDVMLDLVMNHTSVEHPWFQNAVEALKAENTASAYVGYYNFSDEEVPGWYPVPGVEGWWYEAGFWEGMPDLDLTNKAVRAEFEKIIAFWLGKGVSAFRLDAVKEFVTGDTAANVEILKWVDGAVKAVRPEAYIVAENWDTSAGYFEYYASGVDSFFNFPFAAAEGTLAKTLLGSTGPTQYGEAVAAIPQQIAQFSDSGTDAAFFTNHDTARAAGFLKRDESLIKMAWAMNLLQGGNAFLYYGEELGMSGSGKDENKRAPMYWSGIPGVYGMAVGPAEMEPQAHSFPPAMEQIVDDSSILQFVRKANYIRAGYPAIARGSSTVLDAGGALALARTWEEQTVVLVYNTTAEAMEVALPREAGGATLADYLSATGAAVQLEGGTLSLPAYSIVVLQAPLIEAGETGDDSDAG